MHQPFVATMIINPQGGTGNNGWRYASLLLRHCLQSVGPKAGICFIFIFVIPYRIMNPWLLMTGTLHKSIILWNRPDALRQKWLVNCIDLIRCLIRV